MADSFPLEIWITTDAATANAAEPNEEVCGGWGAVLLFGPFSKPVCGGLRNTSPIELELAAVAGALGYVKRPVPAVITVASRLEAIDIPALVSEAKAADWKNAEGVESHLSPFLKRIDELTAPFEGKIRWNWVRVSSPSASDGKYLIQARNKAKEGLCEMLRAKASESKPDAA